tara:strand:+ start:274 stop:537 length:264 start_codon:yes stop_codon:yes gene_type:complete
MAWWPYIHIANHGDSKAPGGASTTPPPGAFYLREVTVEQLFSINQVREQLLTIKQVSDRFGVPESWLYERSRHNALLGDTSDSRRHH